MKYSLIVVTMLASAAGCSRSLPFSFQFASSEPDLLGAPSDMAAGGGDQAVSIDQGGSIDQAMSFDQASFDQGAFDQGAIDQLSGKDQASIPIDLKAPPDLLVIPDMTRIRRQIGGPCAIAADCVEGLECLLDLNDKALEFSGGYCSKLCEPNTPNACGAGAACVPFYTPPASQTPIYYCARTCLILTDCRDAKYSCCAPVSSALTSVCAPEGLEYCQ